MIVMGDMNEYIGILGEEANTNGTPLPDFAEENELEILNVTLAQGRVTLAERGRKLAIDYLLLRVTFNEMSLQKIFFLLTNSQKITCLDSPGVTVISIKNI